MNKLSSRQWTEYGPGVCIDDVLMIARGIYQHNLLLGIENVSGSTLRGKAREYGARYRVSRENLLKRVQEGFQVRVRVADHGARVVTISRKGGTA